MAIISAEDQQTIREIFRERLPNDVRITNFSQRESDPAVPENECTYCQETRELLEEVASLTDRIQIETKDFHADRETATAYGIERIPGFVLEGRARGMVRQFGIPAGYEFSALIESLLDISTGETSLSPQTKQALATIDVPTHIQVFVTPTCPYCPRAAILAHKLAIENEHITSDVIEAMEFPELASKYSIQAVPKTVINDDIEFEGALPEAQFVAQVLAAAERARQAPQKPID